MSYIFHISIYLQILLSIVTAKPLIGDENIVPAGENEFPFIVSIGYNFGGRGHICTGTLITRMHVLTAAHCFQNVGRAYNLVVLVSTNDLDNGGRKYRLSRTDSWITYNDWAKKDNKVPVYDCNDIAIITLSREIEENIPLPIISTEKDEKHYNKIAVTAGWGDMKDRVKPNLLQKVPLHVMSRTECEDTVEKLGYPRSEVLLNEICTIAYPRVMLGWGDSGGPLLINGNEIIGVNQGICPKDRQHHRNAYNIHASIEYYRMFISIVSNMVL